MRLVLFCLAALSVAPSARAQQALVLSGGGARGLAHVGVLLQLEQLGYDPDLVVGTSMGAVIGALYAAGYQPDEIRDRVLAVQWSEIFAPTPALLGPDRAPRLPMLTFGLDLTGRRVSRGLFGEWRINRALARLLFDANARARGDFDRLPRRYRAVAADLETGEKVVLEAGDLARATRASMAYPGFLAPVRWDDRVLVDGGIAANLPTGVASGLGATYVVAVDVSRPPDEVSSLEPLTVAQRALNLMQQNAHSDSIPPDVLVLPVTDGALAGPGFPDDPMPLIELGLASARQTLPPPPSHSTELERPASSPPDSFAALRIEAPDSALAAIARQAFAPVAPGPYDVDAVLDAVDQLYSTGLFEGIWPRVEGPENADADATLVVRLDAGAHVSLSIGAGFENDRGGRGWIALDRYVAIGHRPVLLSAAASTDGLERWGAVSARVHALADPSIALSLGTHLQESSVRSFAEDTRTTTEVLRAGGWVGVEFPHILREHLIALSVRAERVDPEDAPGAWSVGPMLRVSSIPSPVQIVGAPLQLLAEARWGEASYRRVALAGSITERWRDLQAAALVDFRTVSSGAPSDVQPALGDQHAVPGLRWGEGRGRARAVAGLDLALPTPLGGFARLRLRSGAVADEPADWERARWVTGAQIGGVWRIPYGMLEAGYGLATTGDGRFDVSIGRRF